MVNVRTVRPTASLSARFGAKIERVYVYGGGIAPRANDLPERSPEAASRRSYFFALGPLLPTMCRSEPSDSPINSVCGMTRATLLSVVSCLIYLRWLLPVEQRIYCSEFRVGDVTLDFHFSEIRDQVSPAVVVAGGEIAQPSHHEHAHCQEEA
jgi:hypothetical protein